jgi:hypothetical protein
MKTIHKAIGFCGLLLIVAMGGCTAAILNLPPVVLGSELNGNGSVEYLCLGRDCEELR